MDKIDLRLFVLVFLGLSSCSYALTQSTDSDANITEKPVSSALMEQIERSSMHGMELLGIDSTSTSESIVEAINTLVVELQENEGDYDSWKDISIPLGVLWGQQLVKQLGWEWANLTFHAHGETNALGVLSPDRSLAIYPTYFIYGCLENQAQVKILLSWNMLLNEGSIPEMPAESYTNVMENIGFIFPPW